MKIPCAAGAERKKLAACISEYLGCEATYLRAPSFAWQIGCVTVDRSGDIVFADGSLTENEVAGLRAALADAGFTTGLTVTMPLDAADPDKLGRLLEGKGALIQKALGVDALPVEVDAERISFPWFTSVPDADTAKAWTDFIAAICRMSREQSRINKTEHVVENEKYAFRCFLLRLGFIGDEYKLDRKILLRNLSGSSAFRKGKEK